MATSKTQAPGFEASLTSLEKIVAQLESGDLPLERALEIFEEGVGLARQCQSHLAEAERKVEMLLRERNELKAVPFDPDEDISEKSKPRASSAPKPTAPARTTAIDFDEFEDDNDIPF